MLWLRINKRRNLFLINYKFFIQPLIRILIKRLLLFFYWIMNISCNCLLILIIRELHFINQFYILYIIQIENISFLWFNIHNLRLWNIKIFIQRNQRRLVLLSWSTRDWAIQTFIVVLFLLGFFYIINNLMFRLNIFLIF